jgi:hypothetical protein
MLKGVAEFYRNYPGVKKEADGKYHIYIVNDNESIWGGHNTVEEISSMMGIFPAAIRASVILHTDENLRSQWQEFINHLSPLPVTERSSGKGTWAGSLLPVVHGDPNRLRMRIPYPPGFLICVRLKQKTPSNFASPTIPTIVILTIQAKALILLPACMYFQDWR